MIILLYCDNIIKIYESKCPKYVYITIACLLSVAFTIFLPHNTDNQGKMFTICGYLGSLNFIMLSQYSNIIIRMSNCTLLDPKMSKIFEKVSTSQARKVHGFSHVCLHKNAILSVPTVRIYINLLEIRIL